MLEPVFNKYAGLKACNFIEKRLQHRCFPLKFAKFLRTPLFTEHIRLLLWNYLMNSFFIAFKNNEWCHFVVHIVSPAFISFYCVFFASFYFFFFFLIFLWILLVFGFEVNLSIPKTKQ